MKGTKKEHVELRHDPKENKNCYAVILHRPSDKFQGENYGTFQSFEMAFNEARFFGCPILLTNYPDRELTIRSLKERKKAMDAMLKKASTRMTKRLLKK